MISASARPKESCVLVGLLMNGQVQSLQSLWITWRSQNAQSSETHVVLFSCFFCLGSPWVWFYPLSSSCLSVESTSDTVDVWPRMFAVRGNWRGKSCGNRRWGRWSLMGSWPKTQIACCTHAAAIWWWIVRERLQRCSWKGLYPRHQHCCSSYISPR